MISHEHRCIFVHIPKTAGNSVNRVFGVGWEDHKDLQRYFEEVPRDQFESYFKFAIVRNPWDRLLSDYNYQLKKSRAPSSKLFVFAADGSKRNFAEWVETALAMPDRYEAGEWGGSVSPHINRWTPQIDWISVDGNPRTDFVARLERLPEDFRAICRRLGLPAVRLPHRNRRLHWHYSHYYDRTTRDLVATFYARDIEEFDYEFEHALLPIAFNWPYAHRAPDTALDRTNGETPSSGLSAGEDARPGPSATARPPTRRRLWQHRPGLAIAASVALLLGIFGTASLVPSLAADGTSAPPTEAQQSVRSIIMRSSPRNPGESLVSRARRLGRTMSELNLKLEVLPASPSGAILTFSADPTNEAYGPANPSVISRSSSGPVPRWWLRRIRNNSDD